MNLLSCICCSTSSNEVQQDLSIPDVFYIVTNTYVNSNRRASSLRYTISKCSCKLSFDSLLKKEWFGVGHSVCQERTTKCILYIQLDKQTKMIDIVKYDLKHNHIVSYSLKYILEPFSEEQPDLSQRRINFEVEGTTQFSPLSISNPVNTMNTIRTMKIKKIKGFASILYQEQNEN